MHEMRRLMETLGRAGEGDARADMDDIIDVILKALQDNGYEARGLPMMMRTLFHVKGKQSGRMFAIHVDDRSPN